MNRKGSHVLADRAYGSQEIRSYIISQQAEYVIPPRINAKEPWDVDWWLYNEKQQGLATPAVSIINFFLLKESEPENFIEKEDEQPPSF